MTRNLEPWEAFLTERLKHPLWRGIKPARRTTLASEVDGGGGRSKNSFKRIIWL
jgi:hypothetical protein